MMSAQWPSRLKGLTRLARAPKFATAILLFTIVLALIGPFLSPWDATDSDLIARNMPPAFVSGGSTDHLLGTDGQGRDILTRVMVGGRISLTIALVTIAIGTFIGTALGVIAGYRGGRFDAFISRLIDGMSAFPSILIALAFAVTVGSNYWVVVGVLVLALWSRYARLVRAETLAWKEREFILAAIVTGCSPARVVGRHLLPQLVSTVVVFSTLQVGFVILSEAGLSFLGAGVPPPTPTWGGMISDGRDYIASQWWIVLMPGIAIAAVVISANLLGDWLRDEFDPRLRAT
jgi:peptide/nickel transport system permease protein